MRKKILIISMSFCFLVILLSAISYGGRYLKSTDADVRKSRNDLWSVNTKWRVDYDQLPSNYNPDALYLRVEVISSVDSRGYTYKRLHDRREYNAGTREGRATIFKSQLQPQKTAQHFWPRHFWVHLTLIYKPKTWETIGLKTEPKIMEDVWVYAGPINY